MEHNARILAYKNTDRFADSAIIHLTSGIYSHVELQIDDLCYSSSSRDDGVRSKYIIPSPDRWDVIGITADTTYAFNFFQKHKGKKYDYFGAGGVVLPLLHENPKRFFCNEFTGGALMIDKPWTFSPTTFVLQLFVEPRFNAKYIPWPAQ